MPQLDKVTFFSQFFWLCTFYLGFYYIILKYFLPKISRILALRKKKMSFSQDGVNFLQQENNQVRQNFENILSKALVTSRNVFQYFFSHTTEWLNTSLTNVNKTHYQTVNKFYIQSLGETSLSQNVLLYHASRNLPEKLTVKILLDKMKTLKHSSASKMKLAPSSVLSSSAMEKTIEENRKSKKMKKDS
jgi:hypothetical protein